MLRRGATLAGVGVLLGALLTEQLLWAFGTLPISDRPGLVIYLSVASTLLLLALGACLGPAIRVALVSPVTALRQN